MQTCITFRILAIDDYYPTPRFPHPNLVMALGLSPIDIVRKGIYPLLEINPGWDRIYLSEVADVFNGFPFDSEQFNNNTGKPLIRIRDVGKPDSNTFYDGDWNPAYLIKKGDILVGMDGDFRCAYWQGVESLLNQRVCKITPRSDNFSAKFMYYVLQPYLDAIHAETSSVTVKHLSSKTIQQIPLPNPPLAEQHRIVARIEELFSEIDAGVKELETALARLKIYRQAVLHHFLSNPDWERVKLGSVCNRIADGPFGSNIKTSDYISEAGYQVLRLENIGFMNFIREKETFISEDKFMSLEKNEVFEDDILFSSFVGENVRTTIVNGLNNRAINKADCFCVRVNESKLDRKFFILSMSSETTHKRLTLDVHGATRPRINTTQLKNFKFPLPNLATQTQIVQEIEARLSEADALERTLRTELLRAGRLRQSVLKQAFTGQLL